MQKQKQIVVIDSKFPELNQALGAVQQQFIRSEGTFRKFYDKSQLGVS